VKALVLAVLLAACAKKTAEQPPVPPIPAEEVKRAQDACKAYVDQVCACAEKVPAAKAQCDLARALPEALQLQLSFAAAAETNKNDVLAAQAGVRKAVKACIEETAKLPALGCQ
jgi:hypothetical protein